MGQIIFLRQRIAGISTVKPVSPISRQICCFTSFIHQNVRIESSQFLLTHRLNPNAKAITIMKIVRSLALALFGIVATVQAGGLKTIMIQELQSATGERHSEAIITTPGLINEMLETEKGKGYATGLVWFANDLVVPGTGGFDGGEPMGTQTGHCVEVWIGKQLACYFNFNLDADEGKGTITAEACLIWRIFPAPSIPLQAEPKTSWVSSAVATPRRPLTLKEPPSFIRSSTCFLTSRTLTPRILLINCRSS
jgi:hypothetical protein